MNEFLNDLESLLNKYDASIDFDSFMGMESVVVRIENFGNNTSSVGIGETTINEYTVRQLMVRYEHDEMLKKL